jgi:hypothetical protein
MFEKAVATSWMAGHIRNLFRFRPVQLNPNTWACVVRKGKVEVVNRQYTQPDDYEVMLCFLHPGQIPSWLRTTMAIRKHWWLLKRLALEGKYR